MMNFNFEIIGSKWSYKENINCFDVYVVFRDLRKELKVIIDDGNEDRNFLW